MQLRRAILFLLPGFYLARAVQQPCGSVSRHLSISAYTLPEVGKSFLMAILLRQYPAYGIQ